jgi:hypothetical protein
MERWLQFVEWPDDKSQEEAARVLLRARGEFVKARAGLLLDQDAEKIVRATSTLSIDSDRYRGMLIDRRQMVAQAQLGTNPQTVLDLAQQIKETKESILRQIQAVITDARSVLDRRYGSQPTSMQPAASAPS